jgi:signal transduction histidine kinase
VINLVEPALLAREHYILNPFTRYRFLHRILPPEDQEHIQRIARRIAATRLILIIACLAVTCLDPRSPTGSAALTYGCLLTYAAFSALVLVAFRLQPGAGARFRFLVHAVDVLLVTMFTVFTRGPDSGFYVLLVFVLLGAAYRWGFRETLATALAAGALIFLENAFFDSQLHRAWSQSILLAPHMLMPAVFLLFTGLLAGFLAEETKKLNAESSSIARIVGGINLQAKFAPTLSRVCSEVLRMFGAGELLLAVHEAAGGRLYLWRALPDGPSESRLRLSELEPAQKESYFFAAPNLSWSAVQRRVANGSAAGLLLLEGNGERVRRGRLNLPEKFQASHPCRALLADSASLSRGLMVRIFLLDPAPEMRGAAGLYLLHTLFTRVCPAVLGVYLSRRARAKIAEMERASVARELHDGVIQSLFGIEMQLEVLRKRSGEDGSGTSAGLARIQEYLHEEVLNLRQLMQRLKHLELSPRECLQALRSLASLYQQDSGIATTFETDLDACALPPHVCGEMVRIVQEALTNVKKHSSAKAVHIRLEERGVNYLLEICDDGGGFDFAGRVSLAQMDAEGKGPAVLKERVSLIGGDLAVESTPGRGARLEITVPRRHYESWQQ